MLKRTRRPDAGLIRVPRVGYVPTCRCSAYSHLEGHSISHGGEAITESSNTVLAIIVAKRSALALVTALALAVLGPPRFLRFGCCATR
ncbi:hypothetical protein JMJ77_0000355 [Colletotrichum scovillei]|uniref:Uncharacterized protein n=1 Tax=Colletotrichum scovillei TaxID=1209932 RepID=A0A9P7R9A4_9PEZI|nr:hypothetical protein JMJ77_0000355 [Colletotrichum scovillei]KAG7071562.1 hypothetical protein JMJ76_0004433 [Colletotrichum scovillei]KAG7079812.1 hypothetical protein JMJ78_0006916 [Colletotrichum scovillei]